MTHGISDKVWWFAINERLSSYDESKTPREILICVAQEDDDITVWEPFEDYDGAWVAESITALAKHAQDLILESNGTVDFPDVWSDDVEPATLNTSPSRPARKLLDWLEYNREVVRDENDDGIADLFIDYILEAEKVGIV